MGVTLQAAGNKRAVYGTIGVIVLLARAWPVEPPEA
jgi:hypothetical protein